MSLYSENNSIVHHDGHDYDLNTIFAQVEHSPVRQMKTSDLKWILEYTTVDPERVKNADLKFPLLVVVANGKVYVIDGAHRLTKAVEQHIKYLHVIIVSQKQLEAAKIK